MPSARTIIRRRIKDTPEARALLQRRDAGKDDPGSRTEAALELRKLAEPWRRGPDDDPQVLAQYLQSWGFLGPDDDVEKVRAGLLDSLSFLTEVAPPESCNGQELDYGVAPRDLAVDGPALPQVPDYDPGAESVGVDQAISLTDYARAAQYWTSGLFGASTFGTHAQAMNLIGADWAAGPEFKAPAGRDGKAVNVVIVDEGFNLDYLRAIHPGLNYGGGFVSANAKRPLPGQYVNPFAPQNLWHGNMIARNVLKIAPNVRLYDAPLLPDKVTDIKAFTYDVEYLYVSILLERLFGPHRDEPWVLVNAWAVADSIEEYDSPAPPIVRYSTGALHPANLLLQLMSRYVDIVFAAGNYGGFDPAFGSGIYDRGPERSIRGSNALAGVLCVGATNSIGRWIGASSEGDGPEALKYGIKDAQKPDLCAPSWFSAFDDSGEVSTGTSASCAVAAGMVAALRTTMRNEDPADVFQLLRDSARQANAGTWSDRTGLGLIQMPQVPVA
ncbi:MAG: S8/S53 family peptidase [Pseudomonadota bacterium]